MSQLNLLEMQESEKSISSQHPSLASRSVLPGSEEARMMTAISGRRLLECYPNSGPLGLLAKMLMDSSQWGNQIRLFTWKAENIPVSRTKKFMRRYTHNRKECCSEVYVKTLKVLVTPSNRLLFRLVALEPRMKGIECLLWPTPNTKDGNVGEFVSKDDNFEIGPTGSVRKINRQGTNGSAGLGRVVKMWPTIKASDGEHGGPNQRDSSGNPALPAAVKMWSTPAAQDAKNGSLPISQVDRDTLPGDVLKMWATPQTTNAHGKGQHGQGGDNLQTQCDGSLNPDWVDCLVGLPMGWTNPEVKEVSRENPNRWPAFMGQEQYEWEPLRTCGKVPNRSNRLKMDGNICIAQQIYPVLKAIADIERTQNDQI
jgi:hypothetical protein